MNENCDKKIIDLRHGDCLEKMKLMDDESVDSIVTDPPYGLSFMGKKWDYEVPSVEMWREAFRVLKAGGHLLSFAGSRTYHRMAVNIEDAGFEIRDQIMWVYGSGFPKSHNISKAIDKAAPATPEAQQWKGWGTALKPAHEPIVVARKPLIGTVVENVLEHGTGGLNIDACRVTHDDPDIERKGFDSPLGMFTNPNRKGERGAGPSPDGRWPANFIHDGSDEVVSLFPESARFFYCTKAQQSEKGEDNSHPTVKPVNLMKYLCRLVTPKGGTVLDPFMGSGTTGIAARLEGFNFIGIEMDDEYIEIARNRIEHWVGDEVTKSALLWL
tara:strand:+ start:3758 stop:4738 length:981 start_codon:yes stop_codon:yes gene_type:complete